MVKNMSDKIFTYEAVWNVIHEAYNRLAKKPISATEVPRENYSDACKVLSGISLLDIIHDVNVELKTTPENVIIIFSKRLNE